jgi:hypothetical protein
VTVEKLSTELEAALVRELVEHYDWQARVRFGKQLRRPVIALAETASRLGAWHRGTRTIELSRAFVLGRPWPEVTGVLEHEMAHQYVDEVLGVAGETAHGETFRKVCADRGVDARAAGTPEPALPIDDGDRILDRIRKLLALAGSPNQHEAEIAMKKAHELMLRHNIETTRAQRSYEVRHLGDPEKRRTPVESWISGLLGELFFVEVIRLPVYLPRTGKRGSVYEILGTRANVEMASHVWHFLLATADRLWQANRDDARVKSGRDRLAYQAGVIRGFRDKLLGERVELRGTGLVWVGDGDLDAFFHRRHPRVHHTSRRVRTNGAHAAGREAGRTVVLHKPVERGSSGGGPRLLRG